MFKAPKNIQPSKGTNLEMVMMHRGYTVTLKHDALSRSAIGIPCADAMIV